MGRLYQTPPPSSRNSVEEKAERPQKPKDGGQQGNKALWTQQDRRRQDCSSSSRASLGLHQTGFQHTEADTSPHRYPRSYLHLITTCRWRISSFQWALMEDTNYSKGQVSCPEADGQHKNNSTISLQVLCLTIFWQDILKETLQVLCT